MSLTNTLIQILDVFLPANIRDDFNVKAITRIRARAMIATLMLSIIWPILMLTAFGILHLFTDADMSQALIIYGAIFVVHITQILVFHSYGNLYVTSIAYAIIFYASITFVVFITGGPHSSSMLLLFATPLLTYLMTGPKEAILLAVITFVTGLAFWLLKINGVEFTDAVPPENLHMTGLILWLSGYIIMAFMLVTSYAIHQNSDAT